MIFDSQNSLVDHIGLRWIFITRSHNNFVTTFIISNSSSLADSMDLALNKDFITSKARHCVHIDTDLLIHKINILANDIVRFSLM